MRATEAIRVGVLLMTFALAAGCAAGPGTQSAGGTAPADGPESVAGIESAEAFATRVGDGGGVRAVLFALPDCPLCGHVKPYYEALARRHAGEAEFFVVDGYDSPALLKAQKVARVPTLVVYCDGREVARAVVPSTRKQLAATLAEGLAAAGAATPE